MSSSEANRARHPLDVLTLVHEAAQAGWSQRLLPLLLPRACGFVGEVCVARSSTELRDYLVRARPFDRWSWSFAAAICLDGEVLVPNTGATDAVSLVAVVEDDLVAELHFPPFGGQRFRTIGP